MELVDDITPLLITYLWVPEYRANPAKLTWARQLLVVNSGSTDGTLDVLGRDARIEVRHRPFDSFADQCNFGLSHVRTEWVLSLDADYELSDELIAELRRLNPSKEQAGFSVGFVYRIYGRPLRGTASCSTGSGMAGTKTRAMAIASGFPASLAP